MSLLTLTCGVSQAQAAQSIGDFLDHDSAQGYFNCSYKGKTASKKCLVTLSPVSSSIDPRAKMIYGSNYKLPLMSIKWPDNDISRYVFMDSGNLINLADKKWYGMRDWDQDFELTKGLIIDSERGDHIRLW